MSRDVLDHDHMEISSSDDDMPLSHRTPSKQKTMLNGNGNTHHDDDDDDDFDLPLTTNGHGNTGSDANEDEDEGVPVASKRTPKKKRKSTRKISADSDGDDDDDFDITKLEGEEIGDTLLKPYRTDNDDDTGVWNPKDLKDEDEDEDDVPLSRRSSKVKSAARLHAESDGYSDSEDDIPISKRRKAKSEPSAVKSEPGIEPAGGGDDEDSDDDIPLTQRRAAKGKKAGSRLKRKRSPVGVKEEDEMDEGTAKKKSLKAKVKIEKKMRVKKEGTNKKTKVKKDEKVKKRKKDSDDRTNGGSAKKAKGESVRKYEKMGQKKETPSTTDPARMFYESMYKEKMKLGLVSDMADSWMVKHGLLEHDSEIAPILKRLNLKA